MFVSACLLLAGFLIAMVLPAAGASLGSPSVSVTGSATGNSLQSLSRNRSNSAATSLIPHWITQDAQVRSLPGWLDNVPVLNSNSPEVIESDGILVSTFPPQDKKFPGAHLNLSLNGRFDIFAHHIAKPVHGDLGTLYLGVILQNPGKEPVTVSILQAASFIEKTDAPFIQLPDLAENPVGRLYAGAGDRTTDLILRGYTQAGWPAQITIAPGQSKMLFALPVPIHDHPPANNCRSTIVKAQTTGKVYAGCLAMRARKDAAGRQRQPSLEEWEGLLRNGSLVTPRDRAPTAPKSTRNVIYGRVAGVSRGVTWRSLICKDLGGRVRLNIAPPGKTFSYVLSTVEQGAFGTMNYQSAPLVVRYPDTAHKAFGNYGVRYELSLPLYNSLPEAHSVTVTIQSPYKSNVPDRHFNFREPPIERVFFRGTVRLRYRDDLGAERLRYVHLVLHQADKGKPLVTLKLLPSETRMVVVDYLYPPDCTPPQVLSVETLD